MKNIRHQRILHLIRTKCIRNQEELRNLLSQEGFPVTQATISRDIRLLHLMKKAGKDGVYHYQEQNRKEDLPEFLYQNITKIDYVGNTLVIHCISGTAQAVCTILDKMGRSEIVGTIAGDDTIFAVIRSRKQGQAFAQELKKKLQNR